MVSNIYHCVWHTTTHIGNNKQRHNIPLRKHHLQEIHQYLLVSPTQRSYPRLQILQKRQKSF